MVPPQHSDLKMNGLTAADIYTFGTLHNVDVSNLGNNAINDIVLEMMSIIDPNTIEMVEKQIYVNNIKQEWGIS